MAHSIQQTTINDLPDEMLTKIFNCLKFYGNLRCSIVCKRWFYVVNNDFDFMRTLTFRATKKTFPELLPDKITILMRTYRSVIFEYCSNFDVQPEWKNSLLKNAEYVEFYTCKFKDFSEFKTVVDCCENAKEFKLAYSNFADTTLKEVNRDENARPVKCVLTNTCYTALNYIPNISQLEISGHFISPNGYLNGIAHVLRKYEPVLTSLGLYDATTDLYIFILAISNNLKLKSLCLRLDQPVYLPLLEMFFNAKQNYITSLKIIHAALQPDVLNAVCRYLKNLEEFDCLLSATEPVDLNTLRTLTKLRNLGLNLFEHDETFQLNVNELLLTELSVSGYEHCDDFCLFNESSTKVMASMKVLRIVDVGIKLDAFNQIIRLMPNLEYLSIFFFEFERLNILCQSATGLNGLIHLRTLHVGQEQFIDCLLCTLKLPQLHKLVIVYQYGNELNRIAMDCLAKNCPKLLAIEHQPSHFEPNKVRMIAKRTNESGLFRLLTESQTQMKCLDVFDDDSEVSCSDDDEDDKESDLEWDF